MTPNIAKKIATIAASLPSLKKATRNDEAAFNYVSIDDYYEQVAKRAFEAGLIWTICENGCDVRQLDGEWYVNYRYLFRLYDPDHSDLDIDGHKVMDRAAIEITVLHPLQGAQTTGSAMSYAEKIFMRTLFKCVTGEPDADAFARGKKKANALLKQAEKQMIDEGEDPFDQQPPAPPIKKLNVTSNTKTATAREAELAKPDPFPDVDAGPVADDALPPPLTDDVKIGARTNVLIGKLSVVTSKLELKNWKTENQEAIDEIKSNPNSSHYSRIEKAFAEKIGELNGKKGK